jgi:hypothetical protein
VTNINFLIDNYKKEQIQRMLNTYNLIQVIDFPTRICPSTVLLIDNLSLDRRRKDKFQLYPVLNCLPDHYGQILKLVNLQVKVQNKNKACKYKVRQINEETIKNFQLELENENGEEVSLQNDVNDTFNIFHNTLLMKYENCFPVTYKRNGYNGKKWITEGIRTSCKYKRSLYILLKESNNHMLKAFYEKYCIILSKVITEAKKLCYHDLINKSKNKVQTTWKIIEKETSKTQRRNNISQILIEDRMICTPKNIANTFNEHFI